jgi:uncharacterized protein YbbC (DUF1343 family)
MLKTSPLIALLIALLFFTPDKKETVNPQVPSIKENILTGAEQTEKYLPYLKDKRVGIVGNQTTVIGNTHLVDSLHKLGVTIAKVFGPEHGFRGNASAGVRVKNETDNTTGIPVISLYGPKRKPSKQDLADIDLMIYDIQDVGCRFYTYINVLADVMEACAENGKELLILDRPNPNGYFVDGPVLDMKLVSGIGKFPIPITHGMTIAEFAQMINGEGWLAKGVKCKIKIIEVGNYQHDMPYTLPVKPSPNLNTQQAIMLYPSTCVFEGTALNHGRGTMYPFAVFGSPSLKGKYSFSYVPVSIPGMSETPLYMNDTCYGLDLRNYDVAILRREKKINIQWIKELYKAYPQKEKFFDYKQSKEIGNVDFRTGDSWFKQQIIDDVPDEIIRESWEPALGNYKQMRKKYLLYP